LHAFTEAGRSTGDGMRPSFSPDPGPTKEVGCNRSRATDVATGAARAVPRWHRKRR
jgi:hypothetical protein